MKVENQIAILKMLHFTIGRACTGGISHTTPLIVNTDDGYILRVSERLILKDKVVSMDITPKQILKWADESNGDVFGAYLTAMREFTQAEEERKD